jgi:hypothetical protein
LAVAVGVLGIGLGAAGPEPAASATSAPTPTIYNATNLSSSAATLNASVSPGGTVTSLTFCYSTSAITINGSSCTVASGTIGYATATASPSSSSSAITFSAYATNLSSGTTYYYAAGASQTAGSTSWSTTTTFTTMTGGPFVCTPNFYEETGNYLWQFDAVTHQYVQVDTTAQPTNLNPVGYDTVNNYIYGIGGGQIYQIGSDGNEQALGTPTYAAGTAGDFIPGTNFLVTTGGSGPPFDMEDVLSTSPASAVKPASVQLGTTAGSATFYGNDFSLTYVPATQDYVGYGLKMTASGVAELSTMTIPKSVILANDNSTAWASLPSNTIANAVTVTQLQGITFPASYEASSGDAFGSTYSDSSGDVFFLANTDKDVYEATAAQLASGQAFTLSYEASASFSGSAYDGADCSAASSPFAPPTPENDTYTVVAGQTLTVDGSANPGLLANDQIITGATVTMGTTTLEPSGADVGTTFGSGDTSGVLDGADGTLDVTNASQGYFTFTPAAGFNGAETFTYNLAETYPYALTSTVYATVTINVVQQQVVTWSTPTALSTLQLYTAPNAATDLGGAPITYSVDLARPNTAGCSVNNAPSITYAGAGVCSIVAAAAATTNYSAASAELTFNITNLEIPSLSWSPTPTTLTTAQSGTTITGAPSTDSDGAVSYAIATTGDTAGCTLASAAAPVLLSFTTTGPGQCSVTVSTAVTSTYAADSVTVTFTILAVPTFSWSPSPTSFTPAQSPQVLATATTSSDGVISYSVAASGNTAGCTLASAGAPVELSFTSAGTCTVNASLAASTSYTAAGPIARVFTIGQLSQTVSFTSTAPTNAIVNGTYTPTATGGGSGNPVTFSIDASASSVCSVSAGTVTFNAVGNCVVDADQAGNATYAAAPEVDQTVAVGVIPQAVTFTSTAPTSATVSGTYTPTATGGGSGNPVTFSIDASASSVCSYAAGVVTFTGVGTCLVDADQAGNATYGAAPVASQSFSVSALAQTITFTSVVPAHATVGGTYAPAATGGGSGNPVTFSIDASASSVCSISAGTVTFNAVGNCVVDADQVGNADYTSAPRASQTVVLSAAPVPVPPAPAPTGGTSAGGTSAGGTSAGPAAAPQLGVSVSGAPPMVSPGSDYQLSVVPTIGPSGGAASSSVSFTLHVPSGESVSAVPATPNWSCGLSAGGQALTCTWTGALPLAAGTTMPGVEVPIAVSSSASGALPVTVSVYDTSDDAGAVTAEATSRTQTGDGYLLAGSDGGVFNFGGAGFYRSCQSTGLRCHHLDGQVVGLASTPDGKGYWLAARDGGVFAFGDARFYGSCPTGDHPCGQLSAPVVAMAATPDGGGYWLVTADGTVFAFGDASHLGSCTGSAKRCGALGAPIVGIAAQPDGRGYWLAGASGAVYHFGQAGAYGALPTPGTPRLVGSVVGIASTRDGDGYWLAGTDGGVYAFGDARFLGNTYTADVESQLQGPVVGIAGDPNGSGYWLAGRDGGVFVFNDGGFRGDTYTADVEGRLVGPVVGIAAG